MTYNGPTDHPATDGAPRVWVGCLACYNDGRLVGDWVDGIYATDFVPCMRAGHDEFWVLDFDGYGSALTSETSPADAQAIAEALAASADWCEDNGYPADAFAAYLNLTGYTFRDWEDRADDFADAFAGECTDLDDFAYDYMEECGMFAELPAWADVYRGTLAESFARDLQASGEISIVDGYAFRN